MALEASRTQEALIDDGERMPARDLLIATTARSTGDEFVVTDDAFDIGRLSEMMALTNLRPDGEISRTSVPIPPTVVPAWISLLTHSVTILEMGFATMLHPRHGRSNRYRQGLVADPAL